MRRPNAAGAALQALEPLARKVTELEGKALRGESVELVRMGEELAEAAREAGRRAVEMILDQAAPAPAVRLVVEVDGGHHVRRSAADARRDRDLGRMGYRALRLDADLVEKQPEEALTRIQGRSV